MHIVHVCPCGFQGEKKKPARLLQILKEHREKKTLIFVNTKKGAQRMWKGFSAASEDAPYQLWMGACLDFDSALIYQTQKAVCIYNIQ